MVIPALIPLGVREAFPSREAPPEDVEADAEADGAADEPERVASMTDPVD